MIHVIRLSERTIRACPSASKIKGASADRSARITVSPSVILYEPHETARFICEHIGPYRDCRNASRSGRGVDLWFFLRPGIYEILEIVSAKYNLRYFSTVLHDGTRRPTEVQELAQLTGEERNPLEPIRGEN